MHRNPFFRGFQGYAGLTDLQQRAADAAAQSAAQAVSNATPTSPVSSGADLQARAKDDATQQAAAVAQAGVDQVRTVVIYGVIGVALVAGLHLYFSRK